MMDWGDRERWENSVDPLAEFLFEITHLSSYESDQLARAILALVEPTQGENE